MGAGKTVVGWLVARALGVKFVDLDREIERRAGFPLNEIFNISGEGRFRDLETEALNELLKPENVRSLPRGAVSSFPVKTDLR